MKGGLDPEVVIVLLWSWCWGGHCFIVVLMGLTVTKLG